MNGQLLGREPVMTVSTAVALLIAVLPVFGWSTNQVGVVAAGLVLIGGAVEASLVSVDRLLPLLVGIGKAVLAVVVAFGLHVPDNYVAAVMAVLTVVAGLQVRKQVGAVQPARDRDGGVVAVGGVLDARVSDLGDDTRVQRGEFTATDPSQGALRHDLADAPPIPDRGDQYRENKPRHGQRYETRHGDLGTA